MKVAIIGCGYSGLSAIRRCIELQVPCTAFELSDQVGGVWVYTDQVGTDEFGIPIQTSLYQSVRTNSPKQTLELPGLKFETEEDTCYPRHYEVRNYLNKFADRFNLRPYIKFNHYVTLINRVNESWEIRVRDLKNKIQRDYHFDAVMICIGNTSKPFLPTINGLETFPGQQLHSHDYRHEHIFQNKKVLIVGSAASGIEIALESSTVSQKTYISQRKVNKFVTSSNVEWKPPIQKVDSNVITFSDNSTADVDVIVFCTGYQYHYPFLESDCGITVTSDGHIVTPLYKHFINIHYPTMCFVGLFRLTIRSYLFDFQVQAFLKFLTKQLQLPSKTDMFQWLENENRRKSDKRIPPNHYYDLDREIVEYYDDLTSHAQLENIPPVLFDIFKHNETLHREDFLNLRKYYFNIFNQKEYKCFIKSSPHGHSQSAKKKIARPSICTI